MQPINFCLITDTHYYNPDALGRRLDGQQKTLNDSGAIIDAAIDKFIAMPDCDVMLVGGDLTSNGDRESHDELVKKFRRINEAGKRLVLITSTHDYEQHSNIESAAKGKQIAQYKLEGGAEFKPTITTREELRGLYNEFGFSDAISEFEEFSYVAQIAPGLRVLMLNDDGDGYVGDDDSSNGFTQGQFKWIEEQIAAAHAAGDTIFAVLHHPVMPPFSFYHHFSLNDMHGGKNNARNRDFLADSGIRLVFTGHTHMHNICHYTSPSGNKLTDVNTACLVGYPAPLRICSFKDGVMDIRTECLTDADCGFSDGAMIELYDRTINKIVYSAAHDFEQFVQEANGFSVRRHQIEPHKWLITRAGRFLEKATLGTLGTLFLCRHKLSKSARNVRIVDLATALVRNVFLGTGNYSRDDDVVKGIFILAEKLQGLLGKKLAGTFVADIPALFESILFDDGTDDWTARIEW
ncbi:MAG: metallophosphoesterase [Oscillospiraceae bacterium]|nr:metallophosphoesterase [Oscillospiraceae bacterium]